MAADVIQTERKVNSECDVVVSGLQETARFHHRVALLVRNPLHWSFMMHDRVNPFR